MEYRKVARSDTSPSVPLAVKSKPIKGPTASYAARNLRSGLARLDALERKLSDDTLSESSSVTTPPDSPLSPEEREAAELLEDRRIVNEHWDRYISDGVIDNPDELADFDLCQFWNVRDPCSTQLISADGAVLDLPE
jgi:hypothetical protein